MSEPTTPRTIATGTEHLLCRVEDGVAVLTLNRPERRNALSAEMRQAFRRLLPELVADREVGCVVLTGAGNAFCAGGDVKGMAQRDLTEGTPLSPLSLEERTQKLRIGQAAVSAAIHELSRPVIASLPGPAAGAGLSIALACDIRIAAESAFITTAFANIGFSGDYGGSWFLTRLVGTAKARELYFTADRVDARECERLGIFNRVVPDTVLETETLALAKRIAAGPRIALGYMKENLNHALTQDLRTCLDLEAEHMARTALTEDHREAVRAFLEKRPPIFQSR